MQLPTLFHWRDAAFRAAPTNMALDEALFEWSVARGAAAVRLYHWDRFASTVGYFHRGPLPHAGAVRRFTGGGLVEHGGDLTFCLVLPRGAAPALASAAERYRWIHETLARALATTGLRASLAPEQAPRALGPCFANPVPWDLLDAASGAKIGGGAQRRSRGAVIHQGSLRLPEALRNPDADWIGAFLAGLAATTAPLDEALRSALLAEAPAREAARYGSEAWNRPNGKAGRPQGHPAQRP